MGNTTARGLRRADSKTGSQRLRPHAPSTPKPPRPIQFSEDGVLLTKAMADKINKHMTVRQYQWNLLYTSDRHGLALQSFCSKVVSLGPTVILVRDKGGQVFGGFASQSWERKPKFYGDSRSFLFKVNKHPDATAAASATSATAAATTTAAATATTAPAATSATPASTPATNVADQKANTAAAPANGATATHTAAHASEADVDIQFFDGDSRFNQNYQYLNWGSDYNLYNGLAMGAYIKNQSMDMGDNSGSASPKAKSPTRTSGVRRQASLSRTDPPSTLGTLMFTLSIEESFMSGSSCPGLLTYSSAPCLASEKLFDVDSIEVWGFPLSESQLEELQFQRDQKAAKAAQLRKEFEVDAHLGLVNGGGGVERVKQDRLEKVTDEKVKAK